MSTPEEKPPLLAAVGATGLRRYGGYIDEEFHPELKGTKAVKIFRRMADNSAVIGAFLYVFDMFARQSEWTVEPSLHPRAKGSAEALALAERMQGALHDMETSWPETVGEIMTMSTFGWCLLEMTWKICRGEASEDPLFASTYDDGLITWRDWPIRAQESLDRWEFDDAGRWTAMYQRPAPDYRERRVPREKALLFRTRAHKGNPEGRSLLRVPYRAWFMQTRLEEFECIGAERETAGLHVMQLPIEMFDAANAARLAEYQELVSKIRVDAYGGVCIPAKLDQRNMPTGYDLSRLGASGRNAVDLDTPIRRKTSEILMALVAGWMQMGDGVNGSRSLAETLTAMGARALNGLLQSIDRVVTRDAFPQLCAVNGFPPYLAPRLCHKEIEEVDVTQLIDAVTKLSGAGAWAWGDKDEAWLRERMGAPPKEVVPAMVVPDDLVPDPQPDVVPAA